jgi:hypothetical protein
MINQKGSRAPLLVAERAAGDGPAELYVAAIAAINDDVFFFCGLLILAPNEASAARKALQQAAETFPSSAGFRLFPYVNLNPIDGFESFSPAFG